MKEMRPTMGVVKSALFNILGNINGRSFLDLFSGSGQIALEAHRRGAAPVVCVEAERSRHAEIAKRAPRRLTCLRMDARRAVSRFAKRGESFDIIFADPPYKLGWGKEFPRLIAENIGILAAGGVIIFEHAEEEEAADIAPGWAREERRYGGAVLTLYRREENDQSGIPGLVRPDNERAHIYIGTRGGALRRADRRGPREP
ncbi:RsmD family RNA methyltransferase [Synergistes jonesii]|uniref:Methyltransferase n=1 Tax=Synergistes jonesii TaxID=2754 RepID=A0A073IQ95_9BACT|nr:RsmD family RNA methyltransferase [Synergistes jonesii]KEJ91765.1 hypothetical protein EH55_07270 [Synergistes jonesii]